MHAEDAADQGAAAAAVAPAAEAPAILGAFEVASSIRKWAVSKNLLQALPDKDENATLANVPAATFGDEQESVLRTRVITGIAFAEHARRVIIYTKRKLTRKEQRLFPQHIAGCAIEFSSGSINDLGNDSAAAQGATYYIITAQNGDRYTCGSSISPGNCASAGTLGALVREPTTGALFGLTNNHVSACCSHSPISLPIVAPGILDVVPNARDPFALGYHARTLEMKAGTQGNVNIFENSDAAIFEIRKPELVSSMQGTVFDTPADILAPTDGMTVEKVGRTTGYTKGTIVGRELMPIRVNVAAPQYGYQAIVYFANAFIIHGENDLFSDGGDSGSLVVHLRADGTRAAVGLIFAGGPDSKAPGNVRSFMLPLDSILARLGVTLVTGHHVP